MNDQEVFGSTPEESAFEEFSHSNDLVYWFASDLTANLGYSGLQSMRSAISKAQIVCAKLGIPVEENFVHCKGGDGSTDIKLTRFACYLVAMNGDVKKPEVAKAQAYFAAMAESVRLFIEQSENVERIHIRGEISEREKSLSGLAHKSEIVNYPYFQSQGYRGLYNMNLSQLRLLKRVPESRSPLDFMGKTELAANLFRITQTEERIRTHNIKGQHALEQTAHYVGSEVREAMKKLSGSVPEMLPPAEDIRRVKKELKDTHTKMKKIDAPKRRKGK